MGWGRSWELELAEHTMWPGSCALQLQPLEHYSRMSQAIGSWACLRPASHGAVFLAHLAGLLLRPSPLFSSSILGHPASPLLPALPAWLPHVDSREQPGSPMDTAVAGAEATH